jgi:hypothetical protein
MPRKSQQHLNHRSMYRRRSAAYLAKREERECRTIGKGISIMMDIIRQKLERLMNNPPRFLDLKLSRR